MKEKAVNSDPPRFMMTPKSVKAVVGIEFTSLLPLIQFQNHKAEIIVKISNSDKVPQSVSVVKKDGAFML